MTRNGIGQAAQHILGVAIRSLALFVSLCIVVGTGICLGAALAKLELQFIERERIAQIAIALIFSLATVKEALQIIPAIWGYILKGGFRNIANTYGFVFSLVCAIGALTSSPENGGEGAATPQRDITAHEAPTLFVSPIVFVQSASSSTPRQDLPTFAVPFMNDAKSCDENSSDFEGGAKIEPAVGLFLEQLTEGLVACAKEGKHVEVRVRGYASSKPFCCRESKALCKEPYSPPLSDDEIERSNNLNLGIAKRRAEAVKVVIEKNVDSMRSRNRALGSVDVISETFNGVDAIARKQGVIDVDTETGEYSARRGKLTRRADVVITNVGDCAVVPVGGDGTPTVGQRLASAVE